MTDTDTPHNARRLEDIGEGRFVRGRHRHSAMAADILSPRSEGTLSPNMNRTSLPPLVTSPPSRARLERASSYMSKRLSTFSTISNAHSARSRPQSTAFPIFHSSLPYSLVRDFAYGPLDPLFYGPLPDQSSDISTPASEVSRRLSDPPPVAWHGWSGTAWESSEQLPQSTFAGGPPYEEDEDLHSPVVTSHRGHKKHKSNIVDFDHTRGRRGHPAEQRRGSYTGPDGEGNLYYVTEADDAADGSPADLVTDSSQSQGDGLQLPDDDSSRRDSHFATLPRRSFEDGPPFDSDDEMSEPEDYEHPSSRYSRQYTFSIASPDEEMHGKAVALYDFARENDNELPLVEGQVILVSYRHGQGWLVAQDPKSGESGLVPEEYVRLLRDIEGGWNGLMNDISQEENNNNSNSIDGMLSPVSADPEAKTPTQAEHKAYTPVISTFSTSTKDLEPYPKGMLGTPTNAEAPSFAKAREPSRDPVGAEGEARMGPMEGVEASPEPPAQHEGSQDARS
jgi:hypothetical protein